jgi:hypothetical protein
MSNFRADCDRCCGLCCVVPGFLALQGFRVDKPEETPCSHLDDLHRCSIHSTRHLLGYIACGWFDCFGAGQWITQSLFKGGHWTDAPENARQMFAAYRHWVPRFEAATMTALTCVETTGHLRPTDSGQLRRETLAMIRAALAT